MYFPLDKIYDLMSERRNWFTPTHHQINENILISIIYFFCVVLFCYTFKLVAFLLLFSPGTSDIEKATGKKEQKISLDPILSHIISALNSFEHMWKLASWNEFLIYLWIVHSIIHDDCNIVYFSWACVWVSSLHCSSLYEANYLLNHFILFMGRIFPCFRWIFNILSILK